MILTKNPQYQIDIIVEARMSSSRLPEKILLNVLYKPLLELMIERLNIIDLVDNIIIATTKNPKDDVIVSLCEELNTPFFRGSENDVLGRVLQAAQKYETDIIVEITSDNPLVDPELCKYVIEEFLNKMDEFDFVSNDMGCYSSDYEITYPLGLCNTKIFKTSLLEEVEKSTTNPVDREHVVNYIINNPDKYKLYNVEASGEYQRTDMRFTLDYPQDYEVIRSVFEALYPSKPNFTASDIINFLDANPHIKDLNKDCVQERYEYQ